MAVAALSLLGEPVQAQAAQANWWESLTGSGTPDYTGRRSEDRDRERAARQAEPLDDLRNCQVDSVEGWIVQCVPHGVLQLDRAPVGKCRGDTDEHDQAGQPHKHAGHRHGWGSTQLAHPFIPPHRSNGSEKRFPEKL